MQLAEEVKMYS